jgi:hypothetical protein
LLNLPRFKHQEPFNFAAEGLGSLQLILCVRLGGLFCKKTPENRDFVETLLLECDIGMPERFSISLIGGATPDYGD